jgi:copper chaperone
MSHIVISVDGMTCGGCVKSIERALSQQAGVQRAKASLEHKNVAVEFDASAISQAQLRQAIINAGFEVPG